MTIETVRLNGRARNQLIAIKRKTGIEYWNILCRWALCLSLAEEHSPREGTVGGETGIEMTWRTFGGEFADLYLGLLKQRCLDEGLECDEETLTEQLKLHLHRGIGYLAGKKDLTEIEGLVVLPAAEVCAD